MPIGDNARRIRESKNLTIPQVSEASGIDIGNLSKLETGKRRWNEDNIRAVALALGCHPSELLIDSADELPPIRPALAELLTSSLGPTLTDAEKLELRKIPLSGEPTLDFYIFALARIRDASKGKR